MMCAPRRQIEKVGDRILRPYMTLGTKRKGEGEFILLKRSIYRGNRKLKFDWCIEERSNRCTGN